MLPRSAHQQVGGTHIGIYCPLLASEFKLYVKKDASGEIEYYVGHEHGKQIKKEALDETFKTQKLGPRMYLIVGSNVGLKDLRQIFTMILKSDMKTVYMTIREGDNAEFPSLTLAIDIINSQIILNYTRIENEAGHLPPQKSDNPVPPEEEK